MTFEEGPDFIQRLIAGIASHDIECAFNNRQVEGFVQVSGLPAAEEDSVLTCQPTMLVDFEDSIACHTCEFMCTKYRTLVKD